MTMTNEELDTKVLEAVRAGYFRATAIQAHLKLGQNAMRDVDHALQRLKRRGLIEYKKKSKLTPTGWGWRVTVST